MKSQKNGEATMSNKHSSIEWLVEKIQQANPSFKFDALIRQALAMHKEEIIEAWDNAAIDATYGNKFSSPEQYYNETFGGNNEQNGTK
jgi:hypothetical protein